MNRFQTQQILFKQDLTWRCKRFAKNQSISSTPKPKYLSSISKAAKSAHPALRAGGLKGQLSQKPAQGTQPVVSQFLASFRSAWLFLRAVCRSCEKAGQVISEDDEDVVEDVCHVLALKMSTNFEQYFIALLISPVDCDVGLLITKRGKSITPKSTFDIPQPTVPIGPTSVGIYGGTFHRLPLLGESIIQVQL